MSNAIENNELIQTKVSLDIQLKPEFAEKLASIKTKTANIVKLIDDYKKDPDTFMTENDESTIQGIIEQAQADSKIFKDMNDTKKAFKKYIDDRKNEALAQYDNLLADNGFAEYKKAIDDVAQIKTELSLRRANNRWEELRDTFNASMARNTHIAERYPKLADFDVFRLSYPKLVSGAKTSNVKKKDHAFVREVIENYNTAIQAYDANTWELDAKNLIELETLWLKTPTIEAMSTIGTQLKQRQDAQKAAAEQERIMIAKREEEARRARAEAEKRASEIAEQQRIAKLKNDAMRAEQLKRQEEENQRKLAEAKQREQLFKEALSQFTNTHIPPTIREKYPLYIEDLFRRLNGNTIHANDNAKAIEIWQLATDMTNPNSVVAKETQGNPTRFLEIIRMILDM